MTFRRVAGASSGRGSHRRNTPWLRQIVEAAFLASCVSCISVAAVATDPASIVSEVRDDARPVAIEDLYSARSSLGAVWTADGRAIVLSTNISGRYNLWKVGAAGGWPIQLTRSEEKQSGLAASPDGGRIVFQADSGGREVFDLFAVPGDGGETVNLTSTPDISESNAHFSPDGKLIAFMRKPVSAPSHNVALLDVATRQVRELTHEAQPNLYWYVVGWADSRQVIATRRDFSFTSGSVWKVDIDSGEAARLSPPREVVAASDVSKDGKWLAVTAKRGDGFQQAALLEVSTGKYRWLSPASAEQSSGAFSSDGTLTYTTEVDGRIELSLYDVRAGTSRRAPFPPGMTDAARANNLDPLHAPLNGFAPDSSSLLVGYEASNTPFDYWIMNVASGDKRQLTHLSLAGIDAARLPASQVVHFKSRDGLTISALLWMPFNLERDASAPAVVIAHGGPTWQTTDNFEHTAQALATRGYVVIAPNARGSTGFGEQFQMANVRDLGGGDLADYVSGARFVEATGYVDRRRIGITGGSYGGYMTLMALGKTPEVWAAGVALYGVTDWNSLIERTTPTLRAYLIGLLGDPIKDAAGYRASSAITYLDHIRSPLLVLQGDGDRRTPKEEAEDMVAALKAKGRTVDAYFYPDEGHGFMKVENQVDALQRLLAWFDRHLKATGE